MVEIETTQASTPDCVDSHCVNNFIDDYVMNITSVSATFSFIKEAFDEVSQAKSECFRLGLSKGALTVSQS